MTDTLYIRIDADKKYPNKKKINVKHPAAVGDVILKLDLEKIIIKRPSMDYRGAIRRFNSHGSSGWHSNTISLPEIPAGYYGVVEDETDEDILTIDISKQIEKPEHIGFIKPERAPLFLLELRIRKAIDLLTENGYKVEKLSDIPC